MTTKDIERAIAAQRKAERRARFEQGRASVQHTTRQRNGRGYHRATAKRDALKGW